MSVEFLARLRGKATSPYYEDLAGKSWATVQSGNNPVSTADGKFGGYAVTFNKSSKALRLTNVNLQQSYTISFWAKSRTLPTTEDALIILLRAYNVSTSDAGRNYLHGINIFRDSVAVDDGVAYGEDGTEWHHYCIVYNYDSHIWYNFIDGILLDMCFEINAIPGATSQVVLCNSYAENARHIRDIDDFCVINTCLWTKDFTPPTDYLELPKKIFLSNGLVYGIDTTDAFNKLADSFVDEDDATKLDVLDLVSPVVSPGITELYALNMPINALIGKGDSSSSRCDIVAVPQNEVVLPNNMTSIPLNSKIKLVGIDASVSDGAILMCAITKDGRTYQVWNSILLRWKDINIDDIATDGMTYKNITVIPEDAWRDYNCTELGFAFYLGVNNVSDIVAVKSVVINYTT